MRKRRSFSAEFKARVALEALSGAHTMSELSAKHGVPWAADVHICPRKRHAIG